MNKEYFHDTIEKENVGWHNKNFLLKIFYKCKFGIAKRYASIDYNDIILDFGCGEGWLKKEVLNNYNVHGYDIDPKLTDIDNYKDISPDIIFAIDVFEHITKEEIRKIIKNFKLMNPSSLLRLITIIPTETFLWRKLRKLMGLSETVEDHITPLKDIVEILKEEYHEEKKINFLTLNRISLWRPRW